MQPKSGPPTLHIWPLLNDEPGPNLATNSSHLVLAQWWPRPNLAKQLFTFGPCSIISQAKSGPPTLYIRPSLNDGLCGVQAKSGPITLYIWPLLNDDPCNLNLAHLLFTLGSCSMVAQTKSGEPTLHIWPLLNDDPYNLHLAHLLFTFSPCS